MPFSVEPEIQRGSVVVYWTETGAFSKGRPGTRNLLVYPLIAAAILFIVLPLSSHASHTVDASPGNLDIHVHDTYFHPAGAFLVNGTTDHAAAQLACQKASPDAECDAHVTIGDTITWVTSDPLVQAFHSVTECTDNTFSNCGANVDPVNPISDSGIKQPNQWPYGPVQFNSAGTFYYHCQIHPDVMRGRVVVAPAQATTTPTPSPATPSASAAASATPAGTRTPAAVPLTGGDPAGGAGLLRPVLLAVAGGAILVALATIAVAGVRRRRS